MSDRTKRQRKRLSPLEAGKKYAGWVGFVDGDPHSYTPTDGEDEYGVDLHITKRAARRFYKDVRRVTIIVEDGGDR